MQVAGQDGEFVVLEYAGGDKLYVPVQQLHLVSRYSGAAPESAPLHKLGTDQWAKARKRAAEKIRDVAAELLDLYAQRQARKGPALPSKRARIPGVRRAASRSRKPPTRPRRSAR